MNLEEEIKKMENRGENNENKEGNDVSKILSTLSEEQIVNMLNLLNSKSEQKEDVQEKENINREKSDYKDNYVYPNNEEQEIVGYDFEKAGKEYMQKAEERKSMSNQPPTEISQLIDSAFDNIGDELELDISYRGIIKDVKLVYAVDNNGKYDSIVINYELEDNGLTKYTNDYYRFNWEHNHININKLVSFLKTIDGFYKDDFIAFTVEDIQKELNFLIGANISLKQKLNNNGYRENKVNVLGTFDRINRRMVDR